MAKTAEEKETRDRAVRELMVEEIASRLRTQHVFVVQYRGLTAQDVEELRQKLRPLSSRYLVAKNRLSRIALKQLGLEALVPFVTGQAGFITGEADPIALSKAIMGYAKAHEALQLSGGIVEGEVFTSERLKAFAKLPSREDLYGKTVFLIQSPLSGLVGTLSGTVRKLLYALKEISKGKEKEGGTA